MAKFSFLLAARYGHPSDWLHRSLYAHAALTEAMRHQSRSQAATAAQITMVKHQNHGDDAHRKNRFDPSSSASKQLPSLAV
jgi:hypothetical protein